MTSRRLVLGPPKPPENLPITLEPEPMPQDRIVGRLARVACDSATLARSIDAHVEVELLT